jgi:hypothetical protein
MEEIAKDRKEALNRSARGRRHREVKAARGRHGGKDPPGLRLMGVEHRAGRIAVRLVLLATLGPGTALGAALDPTAGMGPPPPLRGHSCLQEEDTGRLVIWSEGTPSSGVVAWMEESHDGMVAGVPMPDEVARALNTLPPCLSGKHHS